MAVPGFLVPSGFSALPGSGHTATIGATVPLPCWFLPRPQLLCTSLGRKVPGTPCHICFLSAVPTVASKDIPDITSPVASLTFFFHLLSVRAQPCGSLTSTAFQPQDPPAKLPMVPSCIGLAIPHQGSPATSQHALVLRPQVTLRALPCS